MGEGDERARAVSRWQRSIYAGALIVAACGGEGGGTAEDNLPVQQAGSPAGGIAGAPAAGSGGSTPSPMAGRSGGAGTTMARGGSGAAGSSAAGTTGSAGAGSGGAGLGAAGAAGMATAGTTGMGGSGAPAGPDDGDPNMPIVAIPGVPCSSGGGGGFGLGSPNHQIMGMDMIVTYPCEKHAGAPVTFFLNLHGTSSGATHFYQHGYFAAHNFTKSHNLVIVTPSSGGTQWERDDGGVDKPFLEAIIKWVYEAFHGPGKFDIRGMWVGGHSWGAMFTTNFVCRPEYADKIKGAVIMSGIGTNPTCASKIAVISTAAEDDIGPVVNQGSVPMTHGCDAMMMDKIGNNDRTYWPNCDPGFVHSNYLMLGKTHASSIDRAVVEDIVNQIKASRM